ncbi:class I SAM-dependent methyltransferase [Acetilactobacillus jinshanensis]|uniref:Methyltransferase domain-containing protein n=1 Tax=Acetilactobacillus jinshanensis TaxID=1720083 RepID=A0A4P6ZLH3_9LACO|nr:class I SAM-dependent methyltransferase [Acetilactobacillus jinshanensis]QBP18711.1 methyltransferase domain-containing protein [Acetilactobacillus jinshanensis]URL61584.1 methyltransferase domain-containing protein [uncultured bacterium]
MKIPAALKYSHVLLKQVVQRGDNVIDATMGNGNDTAFLAKLVGDHGNVYAFDIQDQALQKTKQRLIKSNLTKSVTLYHTGHQHILDTIGMTSISAAIFNLGYLPGGNKKIITRPTTTLSAIKQCLMILQKGGMIVLVLYYGHPGGKPEKNDVLQFASKLNQKQYTVLKYQFINQVNDPPILVAIQKL